MSTSPLTRVQSSAFINGSALRIKQKQSQSPNQLYQISPLKSTEENEQSPSKIINIYADSALYNIDHTNNIIKNPQINQEHKILKSYTYSQMNQDEAEQAYCERQQYIKNQIQKTKVNAKQKKQEFYESKKTTIKSAIKKQQVDSSTAQSQQIDVSRSSQNFRRISIDQSSQNQMKPIKNKDNETNQSFHLQFQNKKQQLLNDIAKLDKQIFVEKDQKSIQITSPRIQQKTKYPIIKPSYEKQQQNKKVAETQKIKLEKNLKQNICSNRNLNSSQNSKISPQTSPKQPKRVTRSQSQEIKEETVDPLKNSREFLNQRLQRMNEKYNQILEKSNKLRIHFQQI